MSGRTHGWRGILTYDFCPWANRWVYWIRKPIASLSLAMVMTLACAIFVKPLAIVAFVCALLVLLLGYVWPSLSIRGLRGELTFAQDRVTEGRPAMAILRVTNRWPWPVWGIAVERGVGAENSIALASISGWSTAEFPWEFVPTQRGVYPTESPLLVTGFPLGLRLAKRPLEVVGELLVWPKIIPLETLLDAAETRPSEDQFSDHRVGESGDITGTRAFRLGDSLRRVHWAQTARQGRLIVTERQAPTQSAIRVVFDSDPHLHRGEGTDSSLEWSLRIAASVCAAYHRENASVECCFGHTTLPLANGAIGWRRFQDTLARWQPCHNHPAKSCEHEHTSHDCRRIHHHNCGVFQLTVTTDLGLDHRTEHRHVHGDQRMVVLRTTGSESRCDVCGGTPSQPGRSAIVLDIASEVAADFRQQWRHACHAG